MPQSYSKYYCIIFALSQLIVTYNTQWIQNYIEGESTLVNNFSQETEDGDEEEKSILQLSCRELSASDRDSMQVGNRILTSNVTEIS